MSYSYDVVLSFAGEDRNYAGELARKLKEKGIKVFMIIGIFHHYGVKIFMPIYQRNIVIVRYFVLQLFLARIVKKMDYA